LPSRFAILNVPDGESVAIHSHSLELRHHIPAETPGLKSGLAFIGARS